VRNSIRKAMNRGKNCDSLIAKCITVAQTREEAIATIDRALQEFILEGIKTTIPFHLQLMRNEQFRSGVFDTNFMEKLLLEAEVP